MTTESIVMSPILRQYQQHLVFPIAGGSAMVQDRSALDTLMEQHGISRRGFLRGASLSVLALSSGSLLAACGTGGAKVDQAKCVSTDLSATEKTITFSNWIGYVDPVKRKDTSTLEKFQQVSGLTVDYKNGDVNDNEAFFAKVSPQLQACKATGRDVFVVTDWMAARMIDLG